MRPFDELYEAVAPAAGGSESEEQMQAELNTIVEEQSGCAGLDITPESFNETVQALDDLAPWECRRYVEMLASLLKHASAGQWRLGTSGGSVVNDDATACPPDVLRFYGGNPIFESARLADRELIVFLRNIAPSLLHDILYTERVDRINDGLLKACGQLYGENKELQRELSVAQETIQRLMDERIRATP